MGESADTETFTGNASSKQASNQEKVSQIDSNVGMHPSMTNSSPEVTHDNSESLSNTDKMHNESPTGATTMAEKSHNNLKSKNVSPVKQESRSSVRSSKDFNCYCQLLHNELGNVACPMCSEDIPFLVSLEQKQASNRNEIRDLKQEIELLNAQNHEFLSIITKLEAEKQEIDDKFKEKCKEADNMKKDLHLMGEKLLDEVEKRAELQHAKEAFQDELEELSQSLFEEANGLVAAEARKRFAHEKRETILSLENQQLKMQISVEKEQLQELRMKLSQVSVIDETLLDQIDALSEGTSEKSIVKRDRSSPVMFCENIYNNVNVDSLLMTEFQAFLSAAPLTKLSKLTTLPYLKAIIEEDIEPCLKFGGNPKTSTRKLLDCILMNSCYIEKIPPNHTQYSNGLTPNSSPKLLSTQAASGFTAAADGLNSLLGTSSKNVPPTSTIFAKSITERLTSFSLFSSASQPSSSSPPVSTVLPRLNMCSTCGKSFNCQHHFRITNDNDDLWYPICGHCQDRFIAVCDFFGFVRQVKAEMFRNKAANELFYKALHLRRSMFNARNGVLLDYSQQTLRSHRHSFHSIESSSTNTKLVNGADVSGSELKGSPNASKRSSLQESYSTEFAPETEIDSIDQPSINCE